MIDEMDERQQTMQRDVLMIATAAVSLVNGQGFSPVFDPVFFLLRPFIAGTFRRARTHPKDCSLTQRGFVEVRLLSR